MKTAFVYVRVACVKQVNDSAIINQERICVEYAKAQGYEVKEVFIDHGKDANYSNRPELRRMFKAIETDAPSAIICLRFDRIFRNFSNFCEVKNQFKKQGIRLLSVCDGGDITSGLVGNLLAVLAQYESEVAS